MRDNAASLGLTTVQDSTQSDSATVAAGCGALESLARFCTQFAAERDFDLNCDRPDCLSARSDAKGGSQSGNSDDTIDASEVQLSQRGSFHSTPTLISIGSNGSNKHVSKSTTYDLVFTNEPLSSSTFSARGGLTGGSEETSSVSAGKKKLAARTSQKQHQSWKSYSTSMKRIQAGDVGTSATSKNLPHYSQHSQANLKLFTEQYSRLAPFELMCRRSKLFPMTMSTPTGYSRPLPPTMSQFDFATSRSPFRRLMSCSTAETSMEPDSSSLLLGASLRQLFAAADHNMVPDYSNNPVRQRLLMPSSPYQRVRYDVDPTNDLSFGRKLSKLSRFDPLRRYSSPLLQTSTSSAVQNHYLPSGLKMPVNGNVTYNELRTQFNLESLKLPWQATDQINRYNEGFRDSSCVANCGISWNQTDANGIPTTNSPFSFCSRQLITPPLHSTPCSTSLSALVGRPACNTMPYPFPALDGRHAIQTPADCQLVSPPSLTFQPPTFENFWDCGKSFDSSKPYLGFGFI